MNQEKIGKLISSIRKEKGMTQEDLANKLGVGAQAVSKWERGINIPDVSLLKNLANELGVSVNDLLSGEINSENSISYYNKQNKQGMSLKNIVVLITSLILMIIIGICFFFMFTNNKKEKLYKIYSSGEEFNFVGYVVFSKEKNMVVMNSFELSNLDREVDVIAYDMIFGTKNKIILQIHSDENQEKEYLSSLLRKINIEYIEDDSMEEKLINYDDLKNLYLEFNYIDTNQNSNKININLMTSNISSVDGI